MQSIMFVSIKVKSVFFKSRTDERAGHREDSGAVLLLHHAVENLRSSSKVAALEGHVLHGIDERHGVEAPDVEVFHGALQVIGLLGHGDLGVDGNFDLLPHDGELDLRWREDVHFLNVVADTGHHPDGALAQFHIPVEEVRVPVINLAVPLEDLDRLAPVETHAAVDIHVDVGLQTRLLEIVSGDVARRDGLDEGPARSAQISG